ncbi:hypothetical protein ACWGH3_05130 [Streptomyces sp. NPDC054884]|uniref:hypothetical protein n=1 Tax=Streptomyces sp. ME08-AFT2 TaxID=3028683 RepID=UPI0029B2C86C|nr:hypothetical protein [Streptomyces sp. ME08-AFT2]MDX3313935.1 hypothetical protein [Streptomyces sp. ME08-AFT2]
MRTELVSEAGDRARPNEDFASVGLAASGQGGSLVLLDGVTPPPGGGGCLHSVPWFTARLGGALTELTVSLADVPLAEALALAIARTAEAHAETCDLSHPRTPQATAVLARWSPRTVEYLVLCDVTLLLASPDGAVTAVQDDRLARVPRALLRSADVVDGTLRNREGGFFTAAADPSVAARAVTGSVPREEVRSLAALSDGAGRWAELFRQGGWADLLALVAGKGARTLVERVRELELADAASGRPLLGRTKTHDDATVVYVQP